MTYHRRQCGQITTILSALKIKRIAVTKESALVDHLMSGYPKIRDRSAKIITYMISDWLVDKIPREQGLKWNFELTNADGLNFLHFEGFKGNLLMSSSTLENIELGKRMITKLIDEEVNRVRGDEIFEGIQNINTHIKTLKRSLHQLVFAVEHGGILRGNCRFYSSSTIKKQ